MTEAGYAAKGPCLKFLYSKACLAYKWDSGVKVIGVLKITLETFIHLGF